MDSYSELNNDKNQSKDIIKNIKSSYILKNLFKNL